MMMPGIERVFKTHRTARRYHRAPTAASTSNESATETAVVRMARSPLRRGRVFAAPNKVDIYLYLVVGLLITICTALAILLRKSLQTGQTGLDLRQSLLTYGPTAILIVIVSFWRQVDQDCKTVVPWQALLSGNISASRSVLLDYQSPFQGISLATAVRNKSTLVVLGISGFLLLKLATVASTGIFILQGKDASSTIQLNTNDRFEGPFNNSNNDALNDESAIYTAYGLLSKGLEFPIGVGKDHAYTTFAGLNEVPPNQTLSLSVEGFFPTMSCRSATVSIDWAPSNVTDQNPSDLIILHDASCSFAQYQPPSIYALNPTLFQCPPRQLSGTMTRVTCLSSTGASQNETWALFVLTDMRYTQQVNTSQTPDAAGRIQTFSSSTDMAGMTSILCRPSYQMSNVSVLATSDAVNSSGNSTDQQTQLSNYTDDDAFTNFYQALIAASSMFGRSVDNVFAEEYPNTLYKMMASQINGSYVSLLDGPTMETALVKTYQYISVQIASKYLRQNHTGDAAAFVTVRSDQVQVSQLSAAIFLTALVLVTMIAAIILLVRCKVRDTTVPRTLNEYAALVERSITIMPLLRLTQISTGKEIKTFLRMHHFTAESGCDSEQICIRTSSEATEDLSHTDAHRSVNRPQTFAWWTQITTAKWFIALTFVYSCSVISVLEILQRISDRDSGIADLSADTETSRVVVSHYLPAVTLLLLATMFNCLDFNTMIVDPFNRLRKDTPKSVLSEILPIAKHPLHALVHGLRHKRVGRSAASMAAFVGSALTIVVSGLYTVQTRNATQTVKLAASDYFVNTWNDSVSNDNGAAISLSLVENLNMSYPQNTYGSLALPSFVDAINSQALPQTQGSDFFANLTFPALRARLSCQDVDAAQYDISVTSNQIQQSVSINATYDLPEECQIGGPGGNLSFIQFTNLFNFPSNDTGTYLAKFLDLHVGPYPAIFGASQGETGSSNPDNPPGCPSIALIYGYVNSLDTPPQPPEPNQVSVQVCYQYLEQVQVQGSYRAINNTVSLTQAPNITSQPSVAFDSTIGTLSPDSTNGTAYQYRLQRHFDFALSFFNSSKNPWGQGVMSPVVDPFFQGTMFGLNDIDLEVLKLADAAARQTMNDGIQAFYQRYMAQALSSNMRMPASSISQNPAGTLASDPEAKIIGNTKTVRLVQHALSKWILQGMIAFMVIAGLIAIVTIQYNQLLPASCDPCTIWGLMSLWADSEYCMPSTQKESSKTPCVVEMISDEGNAWQSDLADTGQKVRIGWWPSEGVAGQTVRYGIDVVTKGTTDLI